MRNKNKQLARAFVYIFPGFLLLVVFSILPIGMDIYYSFTKYNVIQPPQWIGLDNYRRLLGDIYFTSAVKNTIVYTLISVPLTTITSLLLAAVIAEGFRNSFGGFVKSALFIPVIASSVLSGTLWGLFLSPRGPVNGLLGLFHISPVAFLGRTGTALPAVSIVAVWQSVGYYLVIFYAGLMDIPASLYEAARVDGASTIQRFFYITLPSLSTVLYLVSTLGIIGSFQVFDLVFVMTGGGPGQATRTLVMTIYETAFRENKLGYATAIAIVMFVLVLIVTIIQKRLQRGSSGE
jgi:multiple sugar transport system permease protein